MNFYTYARHYGNDILFRGVKDGKRFTARRGFQPTLFVKSQEKSKYKLQSKNRFCVTNF